MKKEEDDGMARHKVIDCFEIHSDWSRSMNNFW